MGLPLAWIKGEATYQATGIVFVSPRFLANLEAKEDFQLQSNEQYREYVGQNVRTIDRYDILADALHSLGPDVRYWQRPNESFDHAVNRLQSKLVVAEIPDTYQIAVSLKGTKADGLAEIVNAIVKTFLGKVRSEDFYGSDARSTSLLNERASILKQIQQNQDTRADIAAELGVSTFTEAFPNPFDKLLTDAEQALADGRRVRINADAQLAALDGTRHPQALESYVLDQTMKDPALSSLEYAQNQRRTILLSSMNGLSSAHPGRKLAESELQTMDTDRTRQFQDLLHAYASSMRSQRQADARKAAEVEAKLNGAVTDQFSKASWFTKKYQQALTLGQDVERQRKRVDSISDRLDYFALETRAPGFVRLFSTARQPSLPVEGGHAKLFALLLAFAALSAASFPVLLDLLDPRVHWPGDMHRALGFAPMGWLMDKGEAGPEFAREQIFRLANRIGHEHEVNGSHIFAFTSVRSKAGTTTIVTELASALSRMGIPSLAVEANTYRSDPKYRKQNSRGLSVVLHGQSNIEAVVVSGDDQLPDRIPAGDIEHMENLPDLHKLIELLRGVTSLYPIILVDVPPLSISADAELIARSADVAVLVVEAENTTRQDIKRISAQLRRVSPKAVAAVLNRVQADAANGFAKEAKAEYVTGQPAASLPASLRWLWRA